MPTLTKIIKMTYFVKIITFSEHMFGEGILLLSFSHVWATPNTHTTLIFLLSSIAMLM